MVSFIKQFIPPIVLAWINRLAGSVNYYTGNYFSWEQAQADATGYDKSEIINKVYKSATKVKNGEAAFERDSVVYDVIEYNWSLVTACCLARKPEGTFNVLDFGGSLGSSYLQNRQLIAKLTPYKWMIVEQREFVEIGKKEFMDECLEFYGSIEEIKNNACIDIVVLSSVLQYIESPYQLLVALAELSPKIIYIDRTPFISSGCDRLTVQHVPRQIYKASYPAWFLSMEIFKGNMAKMGYELLVEYNNSEKANVDSLYKGLIFERID